MTAVLGSCPHCHAELRHDLGPDEDGVVESVLVCVACGAEWADPGAPWKPAEVIAAVVEVAERRRIPMLGPSCYGRRHRYCTADGCECFCHSGEAA